MTRTRINYLAAMIGLLLFTLIATDLPGSNAVERPCYRIELRSGRTILASSIWYKNDQLRFRRCERNSNGFHESILLKNVRAVYDGRGQLVFPGGPNAYTIVLQNGDTLYARQLTENRSGVRYWPYPAGTGSAQEISNDQITAVFDPKGRRLGRRADESPRAEPFRIVLNSGDTLLADSVILIQPHVGFRAIGANENRTVEIPEATVRHVYEPGGQRIFPIDRSNARTDVLGIAAIVFAVAGLLMPLLGYGIGLFGLGALVAGWISARRTRRRRDKYRGRGRAVTAAIIGSIIMIAALAVNISNN